MALTLTNSYLADSISLFHHSKRLAEKAMEQASDEDLYALLDPEANSIALIVKHVSGNLRSRWTDFLHTDGEKPDRDRDSEFVDPPPTREALLQLWEQGWSVLFQALESLKDEDLTRTVTIRGEAHTVMQAINRSLGHFAYHCGQIVLLAKHFQHENWVSLSIPKGQSSHFNRKVESGESSQR